MHQPLLDFLAAVSFEPGGAPRYDALPGLFTPDGRLTAAGPEFGSWTVADFVTSRRARFESGALTEFSEVELSGRTEEFGDVAHRLSEYGKSGVLDGVRFEARGVISTQFLRREGEWRIHSMLWDDERAG